MGWFGKIVGGITGMALGGPVGAVAGSAIGHGLVDKNDLDINDGEFSFTLTPENQDLYLKNLFSLLAEISRIEGKVTRRKLKFLEKLIGSIFALETKKRNILVRHFNKSLLNKNELKEFYNFFHEFSLYEDISFFTIKVLIDFSGSNGNIDDKVRTFIENVAGKLEVPEKRVKLFYERAEKSNDSPYAILDCFKEDSDDVITKKHRELVSKYHPDKNKDTLDKFLKIQSAYEKIVKK